MVWVNTGLRDVRVVLRYDEPEDRLQFPQEIPTLTSVIIISKLLHFS